MPNSEPDSTVADYQPDEATLDHRKWFAEFNQKRDKIVARIEYIAAAIAGLSSRSDMSPAPEFVAGIAIQIADEVERRERVRERATP